MNEVRGWAQQQAEDYRHGAERPLRGYLGAMGVYAAVVAVATGVARLLGRSAPARITPWDVFLLGVATHKVSRLASKDAVTSPLRAPFVRYEGTAGPAEVHEQVRAHGGIKHALGEMTSCPFCLDQWVATGFVAGSVLTPGPTRLAAATFSAVAVSDWLQLAYAALQRLAEGRDE